MGNPRMSIRVVIFHSVVFLPAIIWVDISLWVALSLLMGGIFSSHQTRMLAQNGIQRQLTLTNKRIGAIVQMPLFGI
jgi:hypothetical protein